MGGPEVFTIDVDQSTLDGLAERLALTRFAAATPDADGNAWVPTVWVYGGDIGSGGSTWLAAAYPERVCGFYSQHVKFPPPSRRHAGLPLPFAQRVYADLRVFREPGRGGHFMAREEPETLASDLRAFFTGLE